MKQLGHNGMVLFPQKHPARSHEKFSQNIIMPHTVLAGLSEFFENGRGSFVLNVMGSWIENSKPLFPIQ